MKSYKFDANNMTLNGTHDAVMPRDESSSKNTCALFSANIGSGERMIDVVNPNTQTIIPENEGVLGENGVDGQDLTAADIAFHQALLELRECVCVGPRGTVPYLNINLHKYEAANSTNLESKERCCICLDEYSDGEDIAKIDCGHLYHVGYIGEWTKHKKTCPTCKRRVSVASFSTLRIRSFLFSGLELINLVWAR